MIQLLEQILSVPVTHMLPKFTPWVHSLLIFLPFPLHPVLSYVAIYFTTFTQPLAQALEELERISYEVSASVNEVTMARDEKAKVLYSCHFLAVLILTSFSILDVVLYMDSVITLIFTFGLQMLQQPSRNVQEERRVFTDFFCHPGRLENQVRELSSRVRAIPE